MIRATLTFICFFVVACSPRLPAPIEADSERNVLEITDLFQTGHARFQHALDQDSLLDRVWHGRRTQIVMVLIDIEWDDGDLEQAQQSGLIMDGGDLILTAGHGFFIDDGRILEMRAKLVTGEEVPLDLLGRQYDKDQVPPDDWALLRTNKPLPYTEFSPVKEAQERHKLMLLGYPGSLGLNEADRVVHVHESESTMVYPLGMICRHHVVDQHTLYPEAGTIPLRGISGAPIFDRNGELRGLFSSIGRRRSMAGWDYIFGMANIPWTAIEAQNLK